MPALEVTVSKMTFWVLNTCTLRTVIKCNSFNLEWCTGLYELAIPRPDLKFHSINIRSIEISSCFMNKSFKQQVCACNQAHTFRKSVSQCR